MYAGGLNSTGKAASYAGTKARRERRIKSGELVSNKVLRARWEATRNFPGYTAQDIAERAGFISKSGKVDTTYLMRQLGLRKPARSVKKGIVYEVAMMDYISYENAVKICRAMNMYPVEAGL